MPLTFGSLFAGIGGFDVGLERAGMHCAWQVENHPPKNWLLLRHWEQVHRWTLGIETLRNTYLDAFEPVELVCGGSPCTDLSLAGGRGGLDGSESRLFHEFVRVVAAKSPRWLLFENVVGLLSSNRGRDMGAVLGALEECGYGWAYRVLDVRCFGRPQSRRRVFIVGRLGDSRPAARALFDPEGCPRNPVEGHVDARRPPRRDGVAGVVCFHEDQRSGAVYENDHTHALTTGGGKPGQGYQAVRIGSYLRKLSVVECERVQGFSDDWTYHPNLRDGQRYAFLGDSVSPLVVEWIGRRIAAADQHINEWPGPCPDCGAKPGERHAPACPGYRPRLGTPARRKESRHELPDV